MNSTQNMPSTTHIKDSAQFDREAARVATTACPLEVIPESVLIHAARYEGAGWSAERRVQILAVLRRSLTADRIL